MGYLRCLHIVHIFCEFTLDFSFADWQRKLRENTCERLERETGTSLVPAAPTFAQVCLDEAAAAAGRISIRLGEAEVEIEGNASPEVVERILRVLRSTC